MKHLIILIFFIPAFYCSAQTTHIPDAKAKQINDKAVRTYIKYGNNHDSVVVAIHRLNIALKLDSNYLTAWTNKLDFECRIYELDSALKTSEKITYSFPGDPDRLLFKGVLELKTGHNENAATTLNKAIKMYEAIPDTNGNSTHLNTAQLNKGIALKLLGKDDESKNTLVALSMKEHDLAVRRHINAYLTKTKEQIIDDMIAGR